MTSHILLSVLLIFLFVRDTNPSFGIYDEKICRADKSVSCAHQLSPDADPSACTVKYINKNECPWYTVGWVFDPMQLPFQLVNYVHDTMKVSAINLTLSIENITVYYLHYGNILDRNYQMCRSFILDPGDIEVKSISWDCLLFTPSIFEGGQFELKIMTNEGSGGRYIFRVPRYFSRVREKPRYEPFLFVHNHIWESTGIVFATVQEVAYEVVFYNISIVSCVPQDLHCKDFVFLRSLLAYPDDFKLGIGGKKYLTVNMGLLVQDPGCYAVSVQASSPLCIPSCDVSLSPVLVIPKSIGMPILGILLLFMILSTSILAAITYIMRKNHKKWIKDITKKPVSILFVYHAESAAIYQYLLILAKFMEEKCYIQPFLVDAHAGDQNPKTWTLTQIRSVKCILLFLPNDDTSESIVPIRNQYQNAISLLEMEVIKKSLIKCCQIHLPWSQPASSELVKCFKKFTFEEDFANLLNWVHGKSFLLKYILWKPIVQEWREYLKIASMPIQKPETKEYYEEQILPVPENGTIPLLINRTYQNEINEHFDHDIKSVSAICDLNMPK